MPVDTSEIAEILRRFAQARYQPVVVFGDATFAPNGQMQSRHTLFRVVDGKSMKLEVIK